MPSCSDLPVHRFLDFQDWKLVGVQCGQLRKRSLFKSWKDLNCTFTHKFTTTAITSTRHLTWRKFEPNASIITWFQSYNITKFDKLRNTKMKWFKCGMQLRVEIYCASIPNPQWRRQIRSWSRIESWELCKLMVCAVVYSNEGHYSPRCSQMPKHEFQHSVLNNNAAAQSRKT